MSHLTPALATMKAVAAQHSTDSSALKKQKAEARTRSVSRISTQSLSTQTGALIQRKCACGGDCPRCQEEPQPHRAPPLQAKLQVSQPGDVYEQEADRIAEQVMSAPQANRSPSLAHRTEPSSLRISRHPLSAATPASDAPHAVQDVLRSAGEPLDGQTRTFMESQFGHDFGHVRVHTGREAMESASSLSARAYTVGGHIVFGSGQYAPSSNAGRRLLAHELTHVVQQGAARVPLIQRDEDPNMRSTSDAHLGAERIKAGIPLEKWSPDVERAYRRSNLIEEANAVKNCREWGMCDKLLTVDEAYAAYRKGRSAAGLDKPQQPAAADNQAAPAAGGAAVAGTTALARTGAAATSEAATTSSAVNTARAARAARIAQGAARGIAAVPSAAPAAAPAAAAPAAGAAPAAAPGAATVGTVAVPIALGVYLFFAFKDLFNFGSFQAELRKLGYVILPSPLGVCIGLCHSGAPARPQPFDRPELLRPEFLKPVKPFPFGPGVPRTFTDDEADTLKDWLDPAGATPRPAPTPTPAPTPAPTPVPVPAPQPDEDDRRRPDCQLVPRTIGRGDDPLANLFCSVVSNDSPSYDIYSRVGRAEIDALRGRTWYECKCGQVSLVRAMKRGERWARSRFEGPTGMDEQIRRQSRVALHCRYNYQVVVASDYVANFFRERYGDIRVEVVNFDPCEK